jgi:hypothetical protein
MRHGQGLVIALLAALLAGCADTSTAHSTAWLSRFHWGGGPQGSDVVQLDVALLERPVGDIYLNQGLWALADEQVVPLESKAVLEDNGFRIGQIGGITPGELQSLLTSERSCIDPRRLQLHAGKPTQVVLGPTAPLCEFRIERDGVQVPVHLEKAQCTLEVVPTLAKDGHTRLRFVPEVQHGETALLRKPAPDLSGWMLKEERPTERYPALSWEVTLASNEYIVIGGRMERPHTFGHECFIRPDEAQQVQRLLVIRTSRVAEGDPAVSAALQETNGYWTPPLACQAAWATVRGSSQ